MNDIISRRVVFDNDMHLMQVETVVDVEPIIDDVKLAADENRGWSKSRNYKRIGSIPMVIVDEMFRKGINLLDGSPESAEHARKWLRENSKFNTGGNF